MVHQRAKESGLETNSSTKPTNTKTFIFVLEVVLIAALLMLWISVDAIRQSKNLWVLFLYSFPCQFLIAVVPHEPVFLFFSKFYAPVTVTLVSVSGTLVTELLNYSAFNYVADFKTFRKIRYSGFVKKLLDIFNRAPFLALWIAGFTPVPFYPFRFLVVLAKYPIYKYILAVLLSRTPRFYLLALLGHALKIPNTLLLLLFILLLVAAYLPALKKLFDRRKKKSKSSLSCEQNEQQ